jgi:hypothetical protein
MKKLVIMPGGFHPFHPGHLALYQSALRAFPGADVYVAATDDIKTRPFPFAIKQKLASLAGIPEDHFVQVRSTFKPDEITSQYDPDDTELIFVRSDKDKKKGPFPGGSKKDGSPAYLQPYGEKIQPMSQHGYMAYLPVKTFGGKAGMQSATEIRNTWLNSDDAAKLKLIKELYPQSAKMAPWVKKVFDQYIRQPVDENQGWAATLETRLVNDPSGLKIQPEGGLGTWNEASLVRNLAEKFQSSAQMLRAGDYGSLYYNLYGSSATRALVKALADLEQFQQKQGKRPLAPGREIQVGEEMAGTPARGGMQASYQARENQPNLDYMDEGHT